MNRKIINEVCCFEVIGGIALFIEPLALQIAEFDVIAVGEIQPSDAGPRESPA